MKYRLFKLKNEIKDIKIESHIEELCRNHLTLISFTVYLNLE